MATKIDNEKLDQYIGELNSLHTEWVNYKKNPVDQGDNGVVNQDYLVNKFL